METKLVTYYKKIKDDYIFDPDVMCDEDERTHAIKRVIETKLSPIDRIIITMYTDLASYRKLGELMGVSHNTIRKEVQRIRAIIIKEIQNETNH